MKIGILLPHQIVASLYHYNQGAMFHLLTGTPKAGVDVLGSAA